MTTKRIHDLFDKMLNKTPAANKTCRQAGMSSQQAATYRYIMKARGRMKIETKLYWLRKANLVTDDEYFSRIDMLSFAKFATLQKNRAALKLGFGYLLDKWQAIPKKPKL